MKDFTTSNYIAPIIDEIEHKYFIDWTSQEVKSIFRADIVLTPADGSNDAYFITPCRDTLIPNIYRFFDVFQEITLYSKAAETAPDELFYWSSREKDRVISAVYNALLKKYTN